MWLERMCRTPSNARLSSVSAATAVDLLIVRCPTSAMSAVQALERGGAELMDCLVHYARDFTKQPMLADVPARVPITAMCEEDAPGVERVARLAFAQYRGHYHADTRVDPALASAVYENWGRRIATDPRAADAVFTARDGASVAGFIALKRTDEATVDIVLNGVDPALQGRGIYQALVAHGLRWARQSGAARCIAATQIDNLGPQIAWVRNGFEPVSSLYTFHRWARPCDRST